MTEQDKDKFEEITGDDRDDDDPSKKKFLEKYWWVKSKRKKKSSLKYGYTVESAKVHAI